MKYLFVAGLLCAISSWAQEIQQLNHEPKRFVDSTGRYYQQASMPVYLLIATSQGGETMPLKSTKAAGIELEGHGVHSIKHQNSITKVADEFLIFADGRPPTTNISLKGAPLFRTSKTEFYGNGLEVELAARDKMSGLESIYLSTDGQNFSSYQKKSINKEGNYHFYYYSVDKTGNAEKTKEKKFTVDLSAPESYHNFINISSESVISVNSSIYLTISDSLSGVGKTYYKFDDEEFKPYRGGNIAFKYLSDDNHALTYYSVDNLGNEEEEKSVEFYLDKTAPILSADVLGDKFIVGQRVYFSGRTKLKITAVDNKSGLKEVVYSVNNGDYAPYEAPFYLPNRSGVHNVKFRAVDNKNDAVDDDFEHSIGVIYVDLTGPSLHHSYNGPTFMKADTVFVSPKTTLAIKGSDPESGLKEVAYRFGRSGEELNYEEPISVPGDGFWELEYFGYDNVNNRNAKRTLFVVDSDGPKIISQFAAPANSEGKYPSYTTIYLGAMDNEVGANQIRYSINGGKEQLYLAPLRGFKKNKKYTIKVTASDMLGNESSDHVVFSTGRY